VPMISSGQAKAGAHAAAANAAAAQRARMPVLFTLPTASMWS
jgi:hypothetical protein